MEDSSTHKHGALGQEEINEPAAIPSVATTQHQHQHHNAHAHATEGLRDGSSPHFRVYKRRWFGLLQLVLLNIVVSWDVCIFPFTLLDTFKHANLC